MTVKLASPPLDAVAPQEEAHALFQISNLKVSYEGKTALEGVDLRLAPKRVTALIGPSGCGKTSLLQCLNRLTDMIPRCTVEGTLLLDGIDLSSSELDVVALRRKVGMIFQRPNPFPLSIRRNLELPLKEHGIRNRARLDILIEKSLRSVGLWDEVSDRLNASALSLSGGQQQRLCLARALALEPEVLLMDEPTSSLDPLAAAVVEDLIQSLRGQYTIVIVTHNLAQARRLADDVAMFWMRDGAGRMIETGPVGRVFEKPRDPDTEAYVRGLRG